MIRGLVAIAALTASCAYAQPRLHVVGDMGQQHASTSAAKVEGSLVNVAKMIVPRGWAGYAGKDVDVNRTSAIAIEAGEKWTESFERWLQQEHLVAKADMGKKVFFLDRDPSTPAPSQALASAKTEPGVPTASTPMPSPSAGQRWDVRIEDVKLENTLKRWSQQAKYQLIWDTDREFLIPATDVYSGSFEDALDRILKSPAIRNSDHPLEAVIYANNPPLVRITRLGDK